MVERAARLTDVQLDEPIEVSVHDDPQSLRSLLSRLVGQLDMWNCAMAARPYDWAVENHESVAHLRRRLARVGPAYLANIREVVVCGHGRPRADLRRAPAHARRLALEHHGVPDLGWGDPMRWVAEPA